MNEPLIFSLVLVTLWLSIYVRQKRWRKTLLHSSLLAIPLGIMLPIFVPWQWVDNSMLSFELVGVRFSLGTIAFAFVVGGFTHVSYLLLLRGRLNAGRTTSELLKKRLARVFVALTISTFFLTFLVTDYPIYVAVSVMLIALAVVVLSNRKNTEFTLVGGVLFTLIYFFLQALFNTLFASSTGADFPHLLDLNISGVHIEELLLVFVFSLFWTAVLEELEGYEPRTEV